MDMGGLTNAMLNLTTNEKWTMGNGLEITCMSHPTHVNHTQITVTGDLIRTAIVFMSDILEVPTIDMPLTVLHFGWAIPVAPGEYTVRVFGSNRVNGTGTLREIAWNKRVLTLSIQNHCKDEILRQFERV